MPFWNEGKAGVDNPVFSERSLPIGPGLFPRPITGKENSLAEVRVLDRGLSRGRFAHKAQMHPCGGKRSHFVWRVVFLKGHEMLVEVRFFAQLREVVGGDRLQLELPEPASIGTLREVLVQQVPSLKCWKNLLLFAVEHQHAPDTAFLKPGMEVACFPPVGGG